MNKFQSNLKLDGELQQIIDLAPDYFVIINNERRILFVNKSFANFLNKHEDDIIGLPFGNALGCTHSLETKEGCGNSKSCEFCGASDAIFEAIKGNGKQTEVRINLNDNGDAVDFRITASPLTLDGKLLAIFWITDISNEKRRKMLERMFFHDISNTAQNLIMLSKLMQTSQPEEVNEFKDLLGVLSSSLVSEIQAQKLLTAAENHELTIIPSRINTFDIINEVINSYKSNNITDSSTIKISEKSENINFTSDKILLCRVIGNILRNALEAPNDNKTITIGCNIKNNRIQFWIHNDAYIPEDVQAQLFHRSFSTKGSGRGIGTYSMKLLTERYLKGSIEFKSSVLEGTTFIVSYPLILTI